MTRVHTEADIRAACQQVIESDGERGLTRSAVEKILRERAAERGLEPTAGDHRTVSDVIRAVREERRTVRENTHASASDALDEVPLPEGLEPALEKVRRIYRHAMSEEARRSEAAAQARVRQAEVQAAEEAAALRAELETLERDGSVQAERLDEAEMALGAARESLAALSAEQAARMDALEARERDMRAQLASAQEAVREAVAARIDAEQRTHAIALDHTKAMLRLEQTGERVTRLEVDLAESRGSAASLATRTREAERDRDLALGRLAVLEDECAWLRSRLTPIAEAGEVDQQDAMPTGRSRKTTRAGGGR